MKTIYIKLFSKNPVLLFLVPLMVSIIKDPCVALFEENEWHVLLRTQVYSSQLKFALGPKE